MKRLPDWPERLAEAVEAARDMPFRWGEHDCALFAGDCARAMTGVDPLIAMRGRYASAFGFARYLRRVAKRDLLDLITSFVGAPVPTALARRGDWLAVEAPEGPALSVCLGTRLAIADLDGLAFLPTGRALSAWRIG